MFERHLAASKSRLMQGDSASQRRLLSALLAVDKFKGTFSARDHRCYRDGPSVCCSRSSPEAQDVSASSFNALPCTITAICISSNTAHIIAISSTLMRPTLLCCALAHYVADDSFVRYQALAYSNAIISQRRNPFRLGPRTMSREIQKSWPIPIGVAHPAVFCADLLEGAMSKHSSEWLSRGQMMWRIDVCGDIPHEYLHLESDCK